MASYSAPPAYRLPLCHALGPFPSISSANSPDLLAFLLYPGGRFFAPTCGAPALALQ